jgi:hypothetical protein
MFAMIAKAVQQRQALWGEVSVPEPRASPRSLARPI